MSLTLPPLTLKSVQTAGPRFKSFPSPSDVYLFSAGLHGARISDHVYRRDIVKATRTCYQMYAY